MADVIWTHDIKSDAEGDYAEVYCQTTLTTGIDNADKYFFEVRRFKDIATREEHLSIKVYDAARSGNIVTKASNIVCGEIDRTNIIELESKLINLRIYGVLLGRRYFPKVRQEIEKAYTSMTARPIDDSTILTDTTINSIYEMFVRYIKEVGIEVGKNGLYNIPVDEFKEYIQDTKYSKYKYSDIRMGLAQFKKEINGKPTKGTKCSYGRNDNTIAKGDKRIKVISFVPEVVESYQITELPEDET